MKKVERFGLVLAGMTLMLLPACSTMDEGNNAEAGAAAEPGGAEGGAVDARFLLSMSYDEARMLSPQHLDMSPYCRIAADNILVLKQTADGVPLRVRATGRVFLEVAGEGGMIALAQEAYVDRAYEVILRGRPLMRRGKSLVEGVKDDTVFYVNGSRLQVIGNHRIHKWEDRPVEAMVANNEQPFRGQDGVNVTPNWRKSWQQGPNPLLPALSPDDIPTGMRATPLLPLPDGDDQPKLPGESAPAVDSEGPSTRSLGKRLGEDKTPRVRRVQ